MIRRFDLPPTFSAEEAAYLTPTPRTAASIAVQGPVTVIETPAPAGTFLPEGHEPEYPYPLLVWVNLAGTERVPVHQVMPLVSDRNYLGISVELPVAPESQPGVWSPAPFWLWDEILKEAILDVRRSYNIHTERIYLAAAGPSATAAVQQFMSRPEWFAGVAAVQCRLPGEGRIAMPNFRELQGKRMCLISHPSVDPQSNRRNREILHAAGINIAARRANHSRWWDRKLLREIDRWIMSEICQPQTAK